MAIPSFNKILENNQLIKGRLNVKDSDLEYLYKILKKDNQLLKKRQLREEKNIQDNITKRNKIKSQIKKNDETIQKSFYPSTEKISLLYKQQSNSYYIKARFLARLIDIDNSLCFF